jgi:hypothetical protein
MNFIEIIGLCCLGGLALGTIVAQVENWWTER